MMSCYFIVVKAAHGCTLISSVIQSLCMYVQVCLCRHG